MNESKKTPGEIYLEKARLAGLLNEKSEAGIVGIAKMLDSPYSLEQVQAQIKWADGKREEQKEKFKKQIDSKWKSLFPNS